MAFVGPLEDQMLIRNLVDSYHDAVFRRDADDWGDCWAEDGVWDLVGTKVEGRDAIVGLWTQAMAGFPFVGFFYQMGSLTVDGDTAVGHLYTHEYIEQADGTTRRPIGQYDDRYVRTADGWKFAERRFEILKETQMGTVA